MARRRRIATEVVRPDFPVVPMYVVSVLFLAFFVFTFGRDVSQEVQFSMTLGREGHSEEFLDRHRDTPCSPFMWLAASTGRSGA